MDLADGLGYPLEAVPCAKANFQYSFSLSNRQALQSHFRILSLEWPRQVVIIPAEPVIGALGFLFGSGNR
jgi:hypothetical protein